jgi:hypothetical protein
LGCYIAFIGSPPKKMFGLVQFVTELFPVRIAKTKHFRVGNTVNADRGPGMIIQSIIIGGPPRWQCELQDEHFEIVVYKKGFQTAGKHEIFAIDRIALADYGLPLFKALSFKKGEEIFKLLIRQRGQSGHMGF